jgi:hypothetical protein
MQAMKVETSMSTSKERETKAAAIKPWVVCV